MSLRVSGTGGEIRALTGLRGVAALLVASYHVSGLGLHAPLLIAPLCRHGYLGVDVFFVLSGFLMARNYGARCGGWAAYRLFMARRLARVYPMYIVAVIATFLAVRVHGLDALTPGAGSWPRLAIDLTMLQSLGAGASLLPVTWSLSTEWVAYLVFPALAGLLLHGRARLAALGGILCLSVSLALCLAPDSLIGGLARTPRQAWLDVSDIATPLPLLRCLADFCAGMLAHRAGAWPRLAAIGPSRWSWVMIALGLALCWTPLADFVALPLSACLVLWLGMRASGCGLAARLLASAPCHWLGVVSYPLYLTHLLVWQALRPLAEQWGLPGLAILPPAILVAWIGHLAVERPGQRWVSALAARQAGRRLPAGWA